MKSGRSKKDVMNKKQRLWWSCCVTVWSGGGAVCSVCSGSGGKNLTDIASFLHSGGRRACAGVFTWEPAAGGGGASVWTCTSSSGVSLCCRLLCVKNLLFSLGEELNLLFSALCFFWKTTETSGIHSLLLHTGGSYCEKPVVGEACVYQQSNSQTNYESETCVCAVSELWRRRHVQSPFLTESSLKHPHLHQEEDDILTPPYILPDAESVNLSQPTVWTVMNQAPQIKVSC